MKRLIAASAWLTLLCLPSSGQEMPQSFSYTEGGQNCLGRLVNGVKAKGIHGAGLHVVAAYTGKRYGALCFVVSVENAEAPAVDITPSCMTLEVVPSGKTLCALNADVMADNKLSWARRGTSISDAGESLGMAIAGTPTLAQAQNNYALRQRNAYINARREADAERESEEIRRAALRGNTLVAGDSVYGQVYFPVFRKPSCFILHINAGTHTFAFPFNDREAAL